jgi:hypothetical protein
MMSQKPESTCRMVDRAGWFKLRKALETPESIKTSLGLSELWKCNGQVLNSKNIQETILKHLASKKLK